MKTNLERLQDMSAAVAQFRSKILGIEDPPLPQVLYEQTHGNRLRLLDEEVAEFEKAKTLEDQADALLDIIYVATGGLLEMGIPLASFWDVHKANMTKVRGVNDDRPEQEHDAVKPDDFQPPSFEWLLQVEQTDWLELKRRTMKKLPKPPALEDVPALPETEKVKGSVENAIQKTQQELMKLVISRKPLTCATPITKETLQQLASGGNPGEGIKYDGGKPRVDLIPGCSLTDAGIVFAYGAAKYAPDNWRKGYAWSRIIGAALRHILAFKEGEDNDPESGLTHIGHALCCLMILSGLQRLHPDKDDRPKTGGTP